MTNSIDKVAPVSNLERDNVFKQKCHDLFAGRVTNWNYVLSLFANGAKKYSNGKKILDIGCGTGTLLILFEKLGYKCFGVDFDKVQIAEAKKMARLYNSKIEFEQTEMRTRPFPSKSFDITTSKDVVEHLPNSHLLDYLTQSHNCLKDKGIMMIFTKPTKYSYLFQKKYVFFLLPFVFLDENRFLNYLSFLNESIPKIYKKITMRNMLDTWQDPAPGHCNCPDITDLSDKIQNANFELILSKAFISPHQRYFKLLYQLFSFEVVKPNIFIIARKEEI